MENSAKSKGDKGGQRIAKAMAHAGLCSRREAESWITQGRVRVNGEVLKTPATLVSEDDKIEVDGNPLPRAEKTRLFLYHKPAGLVTTAKDEKGRPTVFDALPADLPRVVSIGRLDMNTEGLLLLTTDGELARYLELPATGWVRRYRVRAHGKITQDALDKLAKGLTHNGVKYGPVEAAFEKQQGANVWINLSIREGKNREVRNIMEALGLQVNRLIRTSYGPFQLGSLPKGGVSEVKQKILKDQLGAYFKQKGAAK